MQASTNYSATMTDRRWRIGIDLGGTKIEAIILDAVGSELVRRRRPTPRSEGYPAIIAAIASLFAEVRSEVGIDAETPAELFSIGIGIPGILHPGSGKVMNANTTELIDHPLGDDLAELLSHPIAVENDANCFALAEARSGSGVGYATLFGIIMGTGCGGGVVLNGAVHHGCHGIAGEWGHFSIDPNGVECWCGQRGCIETMISGSGVERLHHQRLKRAGQKLAEGERIRMAKIVELYRSGDPLATETMEQLFDDFGRALGGILSFLDPDAVVLGGGLSLIDELYTIGKERAIAHTFGRDINTPILQNRLGDSAGVFGAAWVGV